MDFVVIWRRWFDSKRNGIGATFWHFVRGIFTSRSSLLDLNENEKGKQEKRLITKENGQQKRRKKKEEGIWGGYRSEPSCQKRTVYEPFLSLLRKRPMAEQTHNNPPPTHPMKRKDIAESGGAMGKLMADDCLRSKKKKRRRDFFIGGGLSCSFHLTRKSWNRAKGVIISRRSFLSPPNSLYI